MQVLSATTSGHRRGQVAVRFRVTHTRGLLKGHQVEALAAQPGGLHADAVFDVHRFNVMGINVELHEVGELPDLD